jgi:hypothetical protein
MEVVFDFLADPRNEPKYSACQEDLNRSKDGPARSSPSVCASNRPCRRRQFAI